MKKLGWVALGVTLALASACGGKVVVDGSPGTGGAGGQGGSTSSGLQVCGDAPIPGPLTGCSGGASTGSGTASCITSLCDLNGNTFDMECTSTTCTCAVNGAVKCTCALEGSGDFCSGTAPCCPWKAAQGL